MSIFSSDLTRLRMREKPASECSVGVQVRSGQDTQKILSKWNSLIGEGRLGNGWDVKRHHSVLDRKRESEKKNATKIAFKHDT